ncbi:hypothetical protein ACWD3I_48335 [Streptomyces sp. NPDC002817]|uniref:hypothetical protein n=1 Tax=Streptomyces sp. NPDC088357 TaxID=3154655 RepID=UPI003445F649
MTTQGPGGNGTPEEPDGTPSGTEEIWLKFLTDSEAAIRRSAPKELSARERAPGRRPRPADTDRSEQRPRHTHEGAAAYETDAVGDLWQPDDPWAGPAWRDLDNRAKLRRVGRVAVSAAAIILALGAWSWLSTSSDTPHNTPDNTLVQQLEEPLPELSPTTRFPPGAAVTSPSSSAVTAG